MLPERFDVISDVTACATKHFMHKLLPLSTPHDLVPPSIMQQPLPKVLQVLLNSY